MINTSIRKGYVLVKTVGAKQVADTIQIQKLSQGSAAKQIDIPKMALRRILEVAKGELLERQFKEETWRKVCSWRQRIVSHTSHLGRQCLIEVAVAKEMAEILHQIKRLTGWDRLRLYTLAPDRLSLQGTLELGGVRDDFRRFQLPVLTDVPTLQLLSIRCGSVRYRRDPHAFYAIADYAKPGDIHFKPLKGPPKRHIALDYPGLDRGAVLEWVDVACTDQDERLVGKLTGDCLYQSRAGAPHVMKLPNGIWELVRDLADRISDYRSSQFDPSCLKGEVSALDELYWQALRFRTLEDHLKNLLLAMKWDPIFEGNFDRARLYLENSRWEKYFGKLARSVRWIDRDKHAVDLCGFVEVGGVEQQFVRLALSPDDPCTKVFLSKSLPEHQRWFQQRMHNGHPVVFTLSAMSRNEPIPRCHVPYFSNQEGLGRLLPPNASGDEIPLMEHLDVPIPALLKGERPYGKVTLDNKWHTVTTMPQFSRAQAARLRAYAERMAIVIEAVADWKEKCGDLYEGLELD